MAATMTRNDAARWVGALVFSALVIWFWTSPMLWPLKISVVLFHELSHAIAAWITGGTVIEIGLFANQGGSTRTAGGWPVVILNAGYVGSLLWGIGLLLLSKVPKRAKLTAYFLSLMLVFVAIGFVRPVISFGFGFALLSAFGLWSLARFLPADVTSGLIRGLGIFSVLYAVFDIRDDMFGDAGVTDASMLAAATHIPAAVWGVGWLGLSILLVFALRKHII
jgi:hypothetical protein